MLNPMRDKNWRHVPGGDKGRHLWPRLVQKVAEGKTSFELSWKVKVMGFKKKKKSLTISRLTDGEPRVTVYLSSELQRSAATCIRYVEVWELKVYIFTHPSEDLKKNSIKKATSVPGRISMVPWGWTLCLHDLLLRPVQSTWQLSNYLRPTSPPHGWTPRTGEPSTAFDHSRRSTGFQALYSSEV